MARRTNGFMHDLLDRWKRWDLSTGAEKEKGGTMAVPPHRVFACPTTAGTTSGSTPAAGLRQARCERVVFAGDAQRQAVPELLQELAVAFVLFGPLVGVDLEQRVERGVVEREARAVDPLGRGDQADRRGHALGRALDAVDH